MLATLGAPSLPTNLTGVADMISHAKQAVFEAIYRDGRWLGGADGSQCLSGWSAAASGQADSALALLTIVVQTHGVRSILDLPIGDGCFSQTALKYIRQEERRSHPGRPPLQYIGIDIVASLIARHQRYLADAFTQFHVADATMLSTLPRTDLVFSRMMMQHMCNQDVLKVAWPLSASATSTCHPPYKSFTGASADRPVRRSLRADDDLQDHRRPHLHHPVISYAADVRGA